MIRTPIALVPYLLAIAAVAAGLLWTAGDRVGGLGRTVSTGEATIGGPFVLVDQDGSGKFAPGDGPSEATHLSVPMWVIGTF